MLPIRTYHQGDIEINVELSALTVISAAMENISSLSASFRETGNDD
jgi:hypothetical protein